MGNLLYLNTAQEQPVKDPFLELNNKIEGLWEGHGGVVLRIWILEE